MSSFNRALASTLFLLAAFVAGVFVSSLFKWHPIFTGPATGLCAIGLVACGVWLNRAAGKTDGGEDE